MPFKPMDGSGAGKYRGFHVVLKGGKPWGFRLAGGSDGEPLTVVEVEQDGKAVCENGLLVGDQVVRINDVFCSSLATACQLIDSAFRTLTLAVFRGSADVHGRGCDSGMPETLNSPQRQQLGDMPDGPEGGSPRNPTRAAEVGFRHGDESRASMRPDPDIGVSRTGSRVLDEWRRKANQIVSRNPAPAQQFPQQALPQHAKPQHYSNCHVSPPSHQQAAPQVASHSQHPNRMSPSKQPQHHRDHHQHHHHHQQQQQHPHQSDHHRPQRRNSLGGDHRERGRSFREQTFVVQHPSNVLVTASKAEMRSWNTASYTRLQSTNVLSSPSQFHGHRSPPVLDPKVENIYENVGQQAPRLCATETKMGSSTSSVSSVERLQNSGGGKNAVGETRARPAFERERRSLRKLTKDSGYETSPYSESDYANMEWLSDQNSERGLVSPSPTHPRLSSYPAPYWDSLSDHEVPYPQHPNYVQKTAWTQCKTQTDRSFTGRAVHDVSSRCKSAIYTDERDNGYITLVSKGSSQSRRLSTGEGWVSRSQCEQSRERALGLYSSTDSLSSYSSGTSRHQVSGQVSVSSAKSTPSLNQQDGRIEEPVILAPCNPLVASMSSSRSTPNLDKEIDHPDAMVSRKFKKASVYEALANKSGLDFAPTIQSRHNNWEPKERRDGSFAFHHQRSSSASSCQSYHCRQTSTASDCTSSSCTSQSIHSRQVSGHSSYSEDEGRVLSPRSEESLAPSEVSPFPYHGHESLPTFPASRCFVPGDDLGLMTEDLRGSHWRSQPELDRLPPSPGSPPPPAPPVRDGSSLKYMKYGAEHHEKYPSWPVGQSDGGGCSQRSRSWTEGAGDGSKDKAYPPRPKKYSQTSYTQQLKTVMEKAEKVALDDPRFIAVFQGKYFSHFGSVPSEKQHAMSRSASYDFDALCRLDDREFSFRDFKVHSPPERDVAPEQEQRRAGVDPAGHNGSGSANSNGDYWWPSTPSSGKVAQYSKDGTPEANAAPETNQATPMLDRLRLESSGWSGDQVDPNGRMSSNGGAGGRDSITSTTSSQETLKWHGSSSDLSVHSDKQPKPTVESVVHSARVQPPQRHNSESVLYYGADEASAIARSVAGPGNECRRDGPQKRGSLSSVENSDVAPPLPRKTRQWSDQVQKNNYINRIQMQVRPIVTPGNHVANNVGGGTGLRAASLAREEIQPPLSPEFAKPLSVAERIQDLERQTRNKGTVNVRAHPSNRPYVAVAKLQRKQKSVPNGVVPGSPSNPVQRQATWTEGSPVTGSAPEKRMAYLDPEKKHKVSDPELKAIQKQAVWSFFERQTGISPHGRSSSKEGVQFLSRRMAQSLPRDYMQEFKRLQQQQQNEEKKLGAGGPVTATPSSQHPTRQENGHLDKKEVCEAVPACPPRLYRQLNGTATASPRKHAQQQSRGSVASSARSSSSSSTSSSASSVASSPLPRTPSICYNTCTQTDEDTVSEEPTVLEEPPQPTKSGRSASSATPVQTSTHQNRRSKRQGHTSQFKPVSLGDCPSSQVVMVAPSFCEELKSAQGSEQQDKGKQRTEEEAEVRHLVRPAPLQELRTSVEVPLEPVASNVPCEQSPTKSTNVGTVDTVEALPAVVEPVCSPLSTSPPDESLQVSPSVVVPDLPEELLVPCSSAAATAAAESVEEVELRKIEESAKVLRNLLPSGTSGTYTPRTHRRLFLNAEGVRNSPSPRASGPSLNSRCSSPDLPLPPPPKNFESEVVVNDDPLPPPPSINEISRALAEPQTPTNPSTPNSTNSDEAYLSYCEDKQSSQSAYDHNCHRSLIASSKMDKSLSPGSAWEQWHNIRQSNTTLVFHSGEMKTPKTPHIKLSSTGPANNQANGKESESNGLSDSNTASNTNENVPAGNCRLPTSARLSPTSRLKATSSVESLRSVGSSNSTTSSISCWQENEAASSSSSRSSSTAGSLHSKDSDGQLHCQSPVSCSRNSCRSPLLFIKDEHLQRMTEATTQTTPSVTKLGRQKREEELECERLSRDLVNHLSGQDNILRNILVLAPEMKTMADYMEGIFEVDVKERDAANRRSDSTCSSGRGTGSSLSSPPPALEQTKRMSGDSVQLPSDSAYFTTSESKAKFLTRYSMNMQQSAALDDLKTGSEVSKKKEELVDSITRKLKILRMEQLAIREEIHVNDELGSAVSSRVEQLAKSNEVDKFKLHVEEVEKITSLLLGLSGRLARAQNALMTLVEDANPEEKKSLEAKRNKLCEQHEEAKKLKESIDRRGNQVSTFLHKYLSSEEYADYDHFIKMKAKLLMDSREIDDKIKLGEEQMLALRENLKT